jgi:hypothetical protein
MIAAALIVRNEATEIVACLDSLAELDLIVVVDTGSADNTVELVADWFLARPNGPRVVQEHFEWIDDFSAARNYAASVAANHGACWTLHFDADMRLAEGGAAALRAACETAKGRTLAVTQISMRGGWRNRRVLCLRRATGVAWQGRIHESPEADDGETAAGVEVFYGWSESHHADPARNLRILRAEAEREPTPRTCYYLGSELYERGELGEAVWWLELAVRKTGWRAERADALLYLAKIRWRQHRGDEAREACLRSLANVPECREALQLMAEMSFPEQAETWRRFAEIANNHGCLFARS